MAHQLLLMEKIKYILTVIITLCTLITYAQPSQYTPMTASGYQMKRLKVDSTLHLPSFCGVPTLRGSSAKDGALAIDTCGDYLYMWTNQNGWDTVNVSGGGGGSSTDTTSLSNRINLKVDSIRRVSDSVFAWINGVKFFQYTDSVGSGGGDFWKINGVTDLTGNVTIRTDGNIQFNGIDNEMLQFYVLGEDIKLTTSTNKIALSGLQSTTDTSTYKPLGIDNNGQLAPLESWVSGGGGGIDSLKRSSDSVYARKNGNFIFQFKDSVGTNPAPVGYYGAFQDTLTQTAASINTAYPVNLGVTDLSNGVTIANNSKIKIANAGIYNIQFSLQLEKTGSGNMITDIWLRKNGVNIDGTTGKVVLTGSANASPIVAAWNYVIAVSSNDSLELMWSTTNNNVVIKAAPATSPHPSIPSAILTVTQQSGIMAGTGISPLDTVNMLNPYLRKIDTATLSNRINLKLNIADTSVFQRKSIPSYTFLANNTTATANAQALTFKDTSGTYTQSPVWGTSAPTGATNHTYRWTRIGNMVTLNISLVYGTVSTNNTTLTIPLPTDCPTPVKPTGLTAASNFLYPAYCNGGNTLNTAGNLSARGGIRSNSGNNGFEFNFTFTPNPFIFFETTVTYYTN